MEVGILHQEHFLVDFPVWCICSPVCCIFFRLRPACTISGLQPPHRLIHWAQFQMLLRCHQPLTKLDTPKQAVFPGAWNLRTGPCSDSCSRQGKGPRVRMQLTFNINLQMGNFLSRVPKYLAVFNGWLLAFAKGL